MMRKHWFDFVRTTRKKLQRKNKSKTVTHQEAMAAASKVWPNEKEKILRRIKREEKKNQKMNIEKVSKTPEKS